MFLNNWKFVRGLSVVFASVHAFVAHPPAHAVDSKDQLAYCSYVMEQAQAQRDLLRTPIACGRHDSARDWLTDAVGSGRLRWTFEH